MAYTTINKSSLHMNTVTYVANGSTNAQTGVGFQPDWIITKSRTSAYGANVYNSLSGVTKFFNGITTGVIGSSTDKIASFDSDGFTLKGGDNSNYNSGGTGVGWSWKANGGSGASNTNGTITSTVSANTTAGMSIATWSGTGSNGSIGHGLGGVDCMIIKNTNTSRDWYFWQKTMAYNTRLELNNTEAFTTNTDNMTALPDATKINMGVSTQNNGSSQDYVGFFFQEKKGYNKFGSYKGNGNSSNGTFVYTGFAPTFVLIKNVTGDQWLIKDNKRPGYNPNNTLYANLNNTEDTSSSVYTDFLSNGFKLRGNYGGQNTSNVEYVYMAFGQSIVGTNNVPNNAR